MSSHAQGAASHAAHQNLFDNSILQSNFPKSGGLWLQF
jgi:hypothetical protein